MLIVDTDHPSVLQHEDSEAALKLMTRLSNAADDVATTIITAEEQMRGWLAVIHKQSNATRQVPYYERLSSLLTFYTKWTVYPFDHSAAVKFIELRAQRLRLKTMDLKIAAIVLTRNAKLLSANLRDFRQVPDLPVEDWLHD